MNWRFIPYAEFNGALNMAIDVGLLEQAESNPPVLRLYGFAPPCMSIGLAQRLSSDTIGRIEDAGFQLVRRPSGGRAVLHFNDLTYSFIACQTGAGDFGILEHSVAAAYRQICAGLREAFLLLGLNVELGSADAAYRHLDDCFLATTHADLHLRGLKLAGSAQLRRRGNVLQHGSIPLSLEQELMPSLIGAGAKKESAGDKTERHVNLFEVLGRELSFEELNQVMKTGFEKAFSASFDDTPLTATELAHANEMKEQFLV